MNRKMIAALVLAACGRKSDDSAAFGAAADNMHAAADNVEANNM